MSIITLDAKEREKFILYLRQEAETTEGMAKQMKELKVHKTVVEHMLRKVLAYVLVVGDMSKIEDM